VHRRDRLPLLLGGDCPVLLGALAEIADSDHGPGLVMIDGYEDAWPPSLSETGEGSDSELGIALGRIRDRLPPPLDELTPLIDPARVALLGARDATAIVEGGATSVREEVGFFLDDAAIRAKGVEQSMSAALDAIGSVLFWLPIGMVRDFVASDPPTSCAQAGAV
jgi:arginase